MIGHHESCTASSFSQLTMYLRDAWVAQSVKHTTLAKVMSSWLMGSSPASGSVLTAQRL